MIYNGIYINSAFLLLSCHIKTQICHAKRLLAWYINFGAPPPPQKKNAASGAQLPTATPLSRADIYRKREVLTILLLVHLYMFFVVMDRHVRTPYIHNLKVIVSAPPPPAYFTLTDPKCIGPLYIRVSFIHFYVALRRVKSWILIWGLHSPCIYHKI